MSKILLFSYFLFFPVTLIFKTKLNIVFSCFVLDICLIVTVKCFSNNYPRMGVVDGFLFSLHSSLVRIFLPPSPSPSRSPCTFYISPFISAITIGLDPSPGEKTSLWKTPTSFRTIFGTAVSSKLLL